MILFILFCFIVVSAAYHLVWENLAAPTIRMNLRFNLFELRDKLRNFEIDGNLEPSVQALAADLEDVLNNAIRLLHTATISSVTAAEEELRTNPALEKKIEKRQAAIEAEPALKAIYDEATAIVTTGFVINSGGWFLYLVPIVFLRLSYGALKDRLNKILSARSYEIEALGDDVLVPCAI